MRKFFDPIAARQAREIFERDEATFVSTGDSERDEGTIIEVLDADGNTVTEFEL